MRELQRFSLRPIVTRHHQSLRTKGKKRIAGPVIAVLYIVPVLLGLASGWFYRPMPSENMVLTTPLMPVLTVAGTLIAGLLAIFALLFNLRIKFHERKDIPQGKSLYRLIANTSVTAAYMTIPAAVIVAIALVASLAWAQLAVSTPWVLQIVLGVIVALGAHILFNAITVVRRLFALYHRLYSSDLTPDLRLIRSKDNDRDSA